MEYIKYKEDKLPLKLSFSAMKAYNAKSEKDIIKGVDEFDLNDIEILFEAAYKSGCKSEGIKQKYEDIEEILDEVFHEFVAIIPKLTQVKTPETNKKK